MRLSRLEVIAALAVVMMSLLLVRCSRENTTSTTAPGPDAPDVQTISHGAAVDLAQYAVKGKTTIFDFYSDGCGPCRALAPKLEALANQRDDIALVVVDINRPGTRGIDWKSPVARQYSLRSIPHLRVFGPDGAELARGDAARTMVNGWLG